MQVLCLYGPRKSTQAKSEEWTTQTAINCDTLWLQSFGTRNSYLAITKIDMLLYRYCFVLLCISKYKPLGVYINGGCFALRVWGGGGIFGGAYFRNFTVITTLLRPKQPNRYYVSFMQTRFCPPAFISLGDSLSPDKPETRTKYETVFLCLNN